MRSISLFVAGTLLAAMVTLLTGCKAPSAVAVDLSIPYQAENVYHATSTLPPGVKRVAVLPLACDPQQPDLEAGRETLDPILMSELINAKKFEVVQVSPGELQHLTGRANWTDDEVLPANLFDVLKKEYGCDAVLFSKLTEFRAYPPMAVGWRLRLVEIQGKKTIWAGDEQYDAGKPEVIAGALHYQEMEQRQLGDDSTDWLTLNSPRWFGEYSLASLFNTLPAR